MAVRARREHPGLAHDQRRAWARGGAGRPCCFGLRWAWLCLIALGCQVHRAAVHLSMVRGGETPRDASVYIDEQFVGFLGVVAARGVRLPEGEHRITVERVGYFPWDRLVVSDRQPISLDVVLRKIPD